MRSDSVGSTHVYKAYLNRNDLVDGGRVAPHWTRDGAGLLILKGAPEEAVIVRVDLRTGQTMPVLDVSSVRAQLAAATGHEPPYRGLPFESFEFTATGQIEFDYQDCRWLANPSLSILKRLPGVDPFKKALGWISAPALAPETWKRREYLGLVLDVPELLSPNDEWFASIREHNIVLRSSRSRNSGDLYLTDDGYSERFWDIEAPRLKITSGRRFTVGPNKSPWSPDSLTLLAYRRDIRGVFKLPRIHWVKPFESVDYLVYPKAGGTLDLVEPFFVDVRSGRKVTVLLLDTVDHYIQWLGWMPDGSEALIIVYTRDFKSLKIFAAKRDTGNVRLLLDESAVTFVKIQHDVREGGEHGFRLLPDGSGFLWLSTRDGWNHLYRYSCGGQLITKLTSGNWPVYDIVHIGDGLVYFTAAVDPNRPYDVHVCRVSMDGGSIEQLTHAEGIHVPTFAPMGQAFLDTHSAFNRPTRTDLVNADGIHLGVLSEMNISRLEAVGYVPPEEFIVKAADGTTDLWGIIYKPYNFKSSETYPVVEYVYGGPQTIETPRFFAVDKTMMRSMNMPWALAQLGYIVVCLDARGTPGRSKAFHDVICGNWTAGVPDHAIAMDQLCKQHAWMDANRVGIYGHSWGGGFAAWALLNAPNTYHAAVAYAPGLDPWDTMLYEPYLGLPLAGREAYERADLIKEATKVRRPLLMAVGTSDYNVVGTTMKMTRALIEAGIDHELVVIPEAFHHFEGVEEDYFMMKLTRWFDRHVKNRALSAEADVRAGHES